MKLIHTLVALCLCTSFSLTAQTASEIMSQMKQTIAKTNRYSYTMKVKERFGSKFIQKKMKFHIQESPKKVYMKDLDEGVELLYVNGWNNNKAYINPNGFPWVNVSLAITNSQVVEESHHTVLDAGFMFVNRLMNGMNKQAKAKGYDVNKIYTLEGSVTWNKRACYKVRITSPEKFKYVSYTMPKNQSLISFCRDKVISEYLVMEKNNISYGTIKKGKRLLIPNVYAQEVILYIDKQTYIPIVEMLYDDKGFFEKYEYFNLVKNPRFPSDEFTEDCSSYGF